MKKTHDDLDKAGLLGKARLLLQIHDELLYEVDDKEVDTARVIIKNAMEHAVKFPVPLTVSVKRGTKWGSLHAGDIK